MKRPKYFRYFLVFLCICLMTGCYSIRKKFVRKRKAVTEPEVYINFHEYPDQPVEKMYRDYYLFVRGWLDELVKSLHDNMSWKRRKAAIDEAIMNCEQLMQFFNEAGREEIKKIYDELLSIKKIVYIPTLSASDVHSLVVRVERVKREFSNKFSFKKVAQWTE